MPYKDPNKQREFQRVSKQQRRLKLWEYKATLKCVRCGFSHPAALHFHHKDENKEYGISRIATSSWVLLMKEIAKCDVLCANCHSVEHYEKGYKGWHGKISKPIFKVCRATKKSEGFATQSPCLFIGKS